eukprot:NODE_130_length_3512_cov_70.157569_g111_i0.p1 GENE.NODE_130_length_3512_cov_70.157569_g111_i0~~NODE_130_length_3512_cov_70.157569_g111_i0.p1  ORF type:complete len:1098 (-),score=183.09 NODE_130_length_3512_cov_70.157569_g111_i0:116-3409(-)
MVFNCYNVGSLRHLVIGIMLFTVLSIAQLGISIWDKQWGTAIIDGQCSFICVISAIAVHLKGEGILVFLLVDIAIANACYYYLLGGIREDPVPVCCLFTLAILAVTYQDHLTVRGRRVLILVPVLLAIVGVSCESVFTFPVSNRASLWHRFIRAIGIHIMILYSVLDQGVHIVLPAGLPRASIHEHPAQQHWLLQDILQCSVASLENYGCTSIRNCLAGLAFLLPAELDPFRNINLHATYEPICLTMRQCVDIGISMFSCKTQAMGVDVQVILSQDGADENLFTNWLVPYPRRVIFSFLNVCYFCLSRNPAHGNIIFTFQDMGDNVLLNFRADGGLMPTDKYHIMEVEAQLLPVGGELSIERRPTGVRGFLKFKININSAPASCTQCPPVLLTTLSSAWRINIFSSSVHPVQKLFKMIGCAVSPCAPDTTSASPNFQRVVVVHSGSFEVMAQASSIANKLQAKVVVISEPDFLGLNTFSIHTVDAAISSNITPILLQALLLYWKQTTKPIPKENSVIPLPIVRKQSASNPRLIATSVLSRGRASSDASVSLESDLDDSTRWRKTGSFTSSSRRRSSSSVSSLGSFHTGRRNITITRTDGPVRWKRGAILGRGAYGVVYTGLDELTGEMMAVKTLRFEPTDPNIMDSLSLLQNEISLLQRIRHDNIVAYMGVQREKTSVNIFMEYVPGGSIATLLSQFGPLTDDVAALYAMQMVEGLAYLHENLVVHRDIKGSNVLVALDGTAKLADFGSAKLLGEFCEMSASLKGTPFWMAPEVVSRQGYGWQADIWSLGCTVIEMITAQHPFQYTKLGWLPLCTILGDESEPIPFPSCSPLVLNFLRRCLARDTTKRPTAEMLKSDMFLKGVAPGEMSLIPEALQIYEDWMVFLQTQDPEGIISKKFNSWVAAGCPTASHSLSNSLVVPHNPLTPPQRTPSPIPPISKPVTPAVMQGIRNDMRQFLKAKHKVAAQSVNIHIQSAIRIQSIWRGYKVRKHSKYELQRSYTSPPRQSPASKFHSPKRAATYQRWTSIVPALSPTSPLSVTSHSKISVKDGKCIRTSSRGEDSTDNMPPSPNAESPTASYSARAKPSLRLTPRTKGYPK